MLSHVAHGFWSHFPHVLLSLHLLVPPETQLFFPVSLVWLFHLTLFYSAPGLSGFFFLIKSIWVTKLHRIQRIISKQSMKNGRTKYYKSCFDVYKFSTMGNVENCSDRPTVLLSKLSTWAWQWWMSPLTDVPSSLMIWFISLKASITCIHPAELFCVRIAHKSNCSALVHSPEIKLSAKK